ncbi:hypothetical protein [Nonomuraea maritima]
MREAGEGDHPRAGRGEQVGQQQARQRERAEVAGGDVADAD